jgi:hypothetical protein
MSPASGPLRGTAGQEGFLEISVNDPPRGRPAGGGGVHRKSDYNTDRLIFRKCTIFSVDLLGYFHSEIYVLENGKINAIIAGSLSSNH